MSSSKIIPIKAMSAWRGTADCRHCGVRDMVLFADLKEEDFNLIHAPIDDVEYRVGGVLYNEGQRGAGIYTLRKGMIKLVRNSADGRQRVVRVLRVGDVAGLETLAGSTYDSQAIALTEASVCRIPVSVIETLCAHSPNLHRRLMEKWHRALKDADDWLAELNFGTARQRVSNFILKMRSHTDAEIATLFSREDMGAMLDLKLETVSREISALTREGAIEPMDKVGRLYRIIEPTMLAAA